MGNLQPKKPRRGTVAKPSTAPERVFLDSNGNRRRPTYSERTPEEQAAIDDGRKARQRARKDKVATIPDRYVALVNGTLDISELDDEEIFRGQLRNKNGDFRGRPPKFVPAEFVRALREEQARRFSAQMHGMVPEAIEAVERVLKKRHPQPGDGAVVNAAFKTIERFAGRVPETVDLNVKGEMTVLEQNLADVIVEYGDEEES